MKLIKNVDDLIMKVWNSEEINNEEKNEIVKKLQEIEMILQGEKL